MKKRKFILYLKSHGFYLLRRNGKHEVFFKDSNRFAIPRGGSTISKGIIWNFQRHCL